MAGSTTKERLLKTKRLVLGTREMIPQIVLPLAAVDTAGGVVSYQNPYNYDLIITRIILDVTTVATAAGTVSFGVTSSSGTTSAANLIDTLDVHSATGLFDNIGNGGTGGKKQQILPAGSWLTGSKASGATAGLVGNAIIIAIPRN